MSSYSYKKKLSSFQQKRMMDYISLTGKAKIQINASSMCYCVVFLMSSHILNVYIYKVFIVKENNETQVKL